MFGETSSNLLNNVGFWTMVGTVVGALLGLVPRFIDKHDGSGGQEQKARDQMVLANVLMNCVHSTNVFLNHVALLDVDLALSDEGDPTSADLSTAIDLFFAMQTAWMDTLISFRDPSSDEEPDPRRIVIQRMLKGLGSTHAMPDAKATPEKKSEQLSAIADFSRTQLQKLIGAPSGP